MAAGEERGAKVSFSVSPACLSLSLRSTSFDFGGGGYWGFSIGGFQFRALNLGFSIGGFQFRVYCFEWASVVSIGFV